MSIAHMCIDVSYIRSTSIVCTTCAHLMCTCWYTCVQSAHESNVQNVNWLKFSSKPLTQKPRLSVHKNGIFVNTPLLTPRTPVYVLSKSCYSKNCTNWAQQPGEKNANSGFCTNKVSSFIDQLVLTFLRVALDVTCKVVEHIQGNPKMCGGTADLKYLGR